MEKKSRRSFEGHSIPYERREKPWPSLKTDSKAASPVARELALHALGQARLCTLVHTDATRLLIAIGESSHKHRKHLLPPFVEQRLTRGIEPLRDLVRRRFLLLTNLGHNTAVPGVDRFTDLPHLEVEQIRGRGGQVADIRNLASVSHQIAALDGGANFLGRL